MSKELLKRRLKIKKTMDNNSILILFGETEKIRNNDVHYHFRQESNFHYLTNNCEPNNIYIVRKTKKGKYKDILIKPKQTEIQKQWLGENKSFESEKNENSFNLVISEEQFERYIKKVFLKINTYYTDMNNHNIYSFIQTNSLKISKLEDISRKIQNQRLNKSIEEQKKIIKAVKITEKTIKTFLKESKKYNNECDYQTTINMMFAKEKVTEAYPSIVASGNNANTLHYIKNNQTLKNNELVLIDVGSEYKYYASDTTRTFPKNGKYTEEQKEVYEEVLNIQKTLINELIELGSFKKVNERYNELTVKALKKLGLFTDKTEKDILNEGLYKKYSPHSIGHWVGLDVHDPSDYTDERGNPIKFTNGVVLTIEPGIYFKEEFPDIPEKYKGIGIRIEDTIIIRNNKVLEICNNIPKEIEDIEKIMK